MSCNTRLLLVCILLVQPVCVYACPPLFAPPYAPYSPPVIVKEVVHEVIPATFFVPVAVPTIQVGYAPPAPLPAGPPAPVAPLPAAAAATGPSPCDQQVRALTERLARLESLLAARTPLAGGEAAPAPPPQGSAPAASAGAAGNSRFPTLQGKCLVCHGATAAVDGGPRHFSMLNAAGSVSLTPEQVDKCVRKIYARDMPPQDNKKGVAPAADAEVSALVQELSTFTK